MLDFEAVKAGYGNLWRSMTIRPERRAQLERATAKVLRGKSRYLAVERITGVPWFVTGLEHYREADCDFACHLHNGDNGHPDAQGRLTVRTHQVPPGRPKSDPPWTWEESARDALSIDGLDKVDWAVEPIARLLYMTEKFNGLGYFGHNVNSPYVWAGSNHYGDPNDPEQHGKFTGDHQFSSGVIDSQLGCAPLLAVLMEQDPSIALWLTGTDEPFMPIEPPAPPVPPEVPGSSPGTATPAPAPGSWLSDFLAKLARI
jgi:lysozyme family protein